MISNVELLKSFDNGIKQADNSALSQKESEMVG